MTFTSSSPHVASTGIVSGLRFSSPGVVDFVQKHRLHLIDALVTIHLSQLVLLVVVVEHLDGLIEIMTRRLLIASPASSGRW